MPSSRTPTPDYTATSSRSAIASPPLSDELPIRPYRGPMPDDFARAVANHTWMSHPSLVNGQKIVLGTSARRPDQPRKVFGERIYFPGDIHVLIMHPLIQDDLPARLRSKDDLDIAVLLRRYLRWRNAENTEVQAERVARYESSIVLKCHIAKQGHLGIPPPHPDDAIYDAREAAEGFWSAGDVGVLLKKDAVPRRG